MRQTKRLADLSTDPEYQCNKLADWLLQFDHSIIVQTAGVTYAYQPTSLQLITDMTQETFCQQSLTQITTEYIEATTVNCATNYIFYINVCSNAIRTPPTVAYWRAWSVGMTIYCVIGGEA